MPGGYGYPAPGERGVPQPAHVQTDSGAQRADRPYATILDQRPDQIVDRGTASSAVPFARQPLGSDRPAVHGRTRAL